MRNYSFFLGGISSPYTHKSRSASPSPSPSPISEKPPFLKAVSASVIPTMAALSTPTMQQNGFPHADHDFLNTIPDPRTPSPSQQMRRTSDSDPHPDLSNEVAMLSTKLINAINHQTNLDDTLQHTRHELDAAKQRIAQLEAEADGHAHSITNGVLVKKAEIDATMQQMRAELAEAKAEREASDSAKKQMEVELENLTSALFEEANTMVSSARKENEVVERRNAQLKSQLQDTELLLASQQEQLQDLKGVMERLSSERDETETAPHPSTAPSTPGPDSIKMATIFDNIPFSPSIPVEIPPEQPLHFSHLISPVMRTDLQAYNDFADLLKSSRASATHGRSPSGNVKSLGGYGISLPSAASSSPSLPGSFMSSATSSPREASFSTAPALKDNKFYKRCLTEDIEPTLRLDLAPGLSWLARRTVLSAITAGTLVVEPFVAQSKFYGPSYACSLCGEDRRADAYSRRHRFRTSEEDSAQRYPLCEYCLGRVRATGDFTGFLRMVRDGLWRAQTDDEVKGAWEESTRLREKMFWARLGGGVIPVPLRGEVPNTGVPNEAAEFQRMNSTASSYYPVEEPRLSEDTAIRSNSLAVPQMGDPSRAARKDKRVSTGSNLSDVVSSQEIGESDSQDFAVPEPAALQRFQTPDRPIPQAVNDDSPGQDTSGNTNTTAVSSSDASPKAVKSAETEVVSDVNPPLKRNTSESVMIPGSFE